MSARCGAASAHVLPHDGEGNSTHFCPWTSRVWVKQVMRTVRRSMTTMLPQASLASEAQLQSCSGSQCRASPEAEQRIRHIVHSSKSSVKSLPRQAARELLTTSYQPPSFSPHFVLVGGAPVAGSETRPHMHPTGRRAEYHHAGELHGVCPLIFQSGGPDCRHVFVSQCQ